MNIQRCGGFGLRLFISAGMVGLLAAGAQPQVSTAQPAPPFAHASELLATQQNLAATFEITTTYATPYLDTKETGKISVARPNRLRIEIDRYRRVKDGDPWEPTGNGSVTVTDGKQTWNVTTHPKSTQYETQPLSDRWLTAALVPLSPISTFFTKESITPGETAAATNQTVDSETFSVVTAKASGETRAYYFDADGFLRRIITERTASVPATGARAGFIRRDVRLSKFTTLSDSDPDARFAYTPPADSVRVERPARSREDRPKTLGVGDIAPDIVAEDINGKTVKLSDFAGKPVVIKFWATWCWPCRQSMPETEALAKGYGDTATVLAVALWDSRKAFRDFVIKYAAERHTTPDKLPIRFVFDPRPQGQDAGSALYGIRATPSHFVIGKDGKVAAIETGYTGPSRKLAEALATIR